MTDLPTPRPTTRRFASGAAEKLPLSDGDWVLVRRELSYAQQRRLAASGLSGVPEALVEQGAGGQGLTVDLASYDISKLELWLMDWSFVDADGQHVAVSREAIEALTPETAEEIHAALAEYIAEAAAKKARPGASGPGATWSSAGPSAGPGSS